MTRSPSLANILFWGSAALLVSALLVGGASRPGLLSDLVLQFAAVPLLALALWCLLAGRDVKISTQALFCCGLLLTIPLLQLVPLPPALWSALPHRADDVEVFNLLQEPLPWLPVSMVPAATWSSVFALLVPLALLLAVLQVDGRDRRTLTLIVVGISALSVVLGLSQLAFGEFAAVRFYAETNPGETTGFFANRNHFAALLYCAMVFAAVWALEALYGAQTVAGRNGARLLGSLLMLTIIVALVAGLAMARSRAGLALGIVAIVVALGVAIADTRRTHGVSPTKIVLGALGVAFLLAAQFALYRVMARLGGDLLHDARLVFGPTTAEAAQAMMPTGSGIGTFVPVYALFEKPNEVLSNVFANRAHNDWLEYWMEGGILAIFAAVAFLVWYGAKAISAWRGAGDQTDPVEMALKRASVVVIALLLVHSLVDYPLRTAAVASVFALACALLMGRASRVAVSVRREPKAEERWEARPAPKVPSASVVQPSKWQNDKDWPDVWQ